MEIYFNRFQLDIEKFNLVTNFIEVEWLRYFGGSLIKSFLEILAGWFRSKKNPSKFCELLKDFECSVGCLESQLSYFKKKIWKIRDWLSQFSQSLNGTPALEWNWKFKKTGQRKNQYRNYIKQRKFIVKLSELKT